ncbi:MAG: DUF2807 domain-containing protein [Hyphomonadaceae bacterium]|nr:DUF2807 domain-containing protein [Hyphomonadaceae bacterium]
MERFVFVAAIIGAIIFALVQIVGSGPSMTFSIGDFEGGGSDPVVEAVAGQVPPATYADGDIDLRYAAARVVITPEDRSDISVSIDNPGRLPMPEIRAEGGKLIVDGQVRGRIESCVDDAVEVRGYGLIPTPELPVVTIHTPRSLAVDIGSGSSTEIGPSASLQGAFTGCGTARIGDVADTLNVDLSGSVNVQTGAARILEADLAGSGALRTGTIAERAELDIAGSGEVELASVSGVLTVDGAGSGNVRVKGGALSEANIDLAGSGDVEIAAPVESLEVSVVGAGDVSVTAAVGEIDADIAGPGRVRAQSVSGAVRKEVWGSGDVIVGPVPPRPPAPPSAPVAPMPQGSPT